MWTDVLAVWNADPLIGLLVLVAAAAYLRGARSQHGRGDLRSGRALAFGLGLVLATLAVISPLDALALDLLSAQVVQNVLLILVAAPLIALGAPHTTTWLGVPASVRREASHWWQWSFNARAAWRWLRTPLAAWLVFTAALWLCHATVLFEAALEDRFMRTFTQLALFLSAVLSWWTLLHATSQQKAGHGYGMLLAFTLGLHCVLLGMLMATSDTPWHARYMITAQTWNVAPLHDQRIAGIVLAVAAGAAYTATIAVFVFAWLHASGRDAGGSSRDTGIHPMVE